MWKPFLVALAVGFGLVWLFRNRAKAVALESVTYTDKAGEPVFAGPDIDPVTGRYNPPAAGDRAATVGTQVIN